LRFLGRGLPDRFDLGRTVSRVLERLPGLAFALPAVRPDDDALPAVRRDDAFPAVRPGLSAFACSDPFRCRACDPARLDVEPADFRGDPAALRFRACDPVF